MTEDTVYCLCEWSEERKEVQEAERNLALIDEINTMLMLWKKQNAKMTETFGRLEIQANSLKHLISNNKPDSNKLDSNKSHSNNTADSNNSVDCLDTKFIQGLKQNLVLSRQNIESFQNHFRTIGLVAMRDNKALENELNQLKSACEAFNTGIVLPTSALQEKLDKLFEAEHSSKHNQKKSGKQGHRKKSKTKGKMMSSEEQKDKHEKDNMVPGVLGIPVIEKITFQPNPNALNVLNVLNAPNPVSFSSGLLTGGLNVPNVQSVVPKKKPYVPKFAYSQTPQTQQTKDLQKYLKVPESLLQNHFQKVLKDLDANDQLTEKLMQKDKLTDNLADGKYSDNQVKLT